MPDRLNLLKEIGRVLRPGDIIVVEIHQYTYFIPGGYVAFLEPRPSLSGTRHARTAALIEVDHLLVRSPHTPSVDAANSLDDKIWSLAPKIASMLQEAVDNRGNALFCDVSSSEFSVPIGSWPDGELV
jgi:hypothetical protein